jgi:MYXO-CTERM domain-containing protein
MQPVPAIGGVMKRAALAMGVGAAVASFVVVGERPASACGGCFQPPSQTASDITDELMLLTVSPMQSTLYDQIKYAGNPASFAWVLPIHGTVNVGLSADVLFASVDAITQTTIQQPPLNCPVPKGCENGLRVGNGPSTNAAFDKGSSAGVAGGAPVTVLKSENVGPYETVQLSTTDPTALNTWLATNGFAIPAGEQKTLAAYVAEGFNFLAMKLQPGKGVQSMRPVRVTTSGASLSLPLRMAAIGTGAKVGITIWVVADGRYEPQNFPFFRIEDSELVWDFKTSSSNYTTLRQQHEKALGNKGWEIESSLSVDPQLVSDAVLGGGVYNGPGFRGLGGVAQTSDASQDYLPVTNPDGSIAQTADQVRTQDLQTLFAGLAGPTVRFTRIRSDISHAAMTTDFVVQASRDQSELSNIRQATKAIHEVCPIYGNDCLIVGQGTPAEAAASGPHTGMMGRGGIFGFGGSGTNASSGTGAAASGGGNGAGGACSTMPEGSELPIGLAAVAGLVGLVSLRSRRQRSKR